MIGAPGDCDKPSLASLMDFLKKNIKNDPDTVTRADLINVEVLG